MCLFSLTYEGSLFLNKAKLEISRSSELRSNLTTPKQFVKMATPNTTARGDFRFAVNVSETLMKYSLPEESVLVNALWYKCLMYISELLSFST